MPRHTDNHWLEVIAAASGGGTQYAEGATTSPGTGNIALGRYNTTSPTLTDGKLSASQLDVNGNQKVVGNVASAATDSGNPVKVGGKDNAAAPTLTDGQRGDAQLDSAANVKVTLATRIAGEDLTNDVQKVEQRFSYAHIAAGQATTTVKSGAGFLHSITLNGAATATNVTTIYDSTTGSGTVIAIPAATTATVPTTLTYDVSFATGLTILTATANGADMTVSYRQKIKNGKNFCNTKRCK